MRVAATLPRLGAYQTGKTQCHGYVAACTLLREGIPFSIINTRILPGLSQCKKVSKQPHLLFNMPFPFSSLCELLNRLNENRTKSLSAVKIPDLDAKTVVAWFSKHKGIIPRQGPEAVAFLSCLFPERTMPTLRRLIMCFWTKG